MSAGYASRLSAYPNKGVVGLPESFDSKRQLNLKLKKLYELVRQAQHLVVVTGAGISRAAGIPDFRGPTGIWTLEKKRKKDAQNRKRKHSELPDDYNLKRSRKKNSNNTEKLDDSQGASMDFSKAKPTLTHRALTRLAIDGKIKYLITQNVDGLHRKSGLLRSIHCSLHGCVFTEKCKNSECQAEFFRDFDIGGMSFQPTGRTCSLCGGELIDTLLDWEDALPAADFDRSEAECEKSDLVICLGTSLRIEPVGSLPLRAKKFVIVNLQVTPMDVHADLIIKAPVDLVMEQLMSHLGYESNWTDIVPPVERIWVGQTKNKDYS